VTTKTGLTVEVRRSRSFGKVSYEGHLPQRRGRVAWMHCMAPMFGRVQVTNANVYEGSQHESDHYAR
jgi:hypothetical protein